MAAEKILIGQIKRWRSHYACNHGLLIREVILIMWRLSCAINDNQRRLTAAYRAVNPNSRLPAIVDHAPTDGGAPFTVFESGAVLTYLAENMESCLRPTSESGRSRCNG